MKLWETLTSQQKNDLLLGNAVGFFPYLVLSNDEYYDKLYDLCLGYYTLRSGEKTISPFYDKLLSNVSSVDGKSVEEIIGSFIRSKFIDKWNRIYEALVKSQYNVLDDRDFTETKTGTNQNKDTHNITDTKSANNADTTIYDTNIEDNGKVGVHEVLIRNNENKNDVYGYNANYPVGDDVSNELVNEINISDKEKNTTFNSQKKNGTDTINHTVDESVTKTGTDTTDITINETIKNSGREISGSKLISDELNLRNTQIFFDIIYADIDSIIALAIYI